MGASQAFVQGENLDAVTPWWRQRWVAAAAAVVVLACGGFVGRSYLPSAGAEAPGTLVVNTNPAGVPVVIDGQPRGVTPLTLELAPGAHELRLATDGEPRIIPLTITAGDTVSQSIELPKAGPYTGQLTVRSEPSGARVTVDGTPRGQTPLTLDGLMPGDHSVVLANDVSSVTHAVTIEAGATASLVVPMSSTPQGAPVSGWISVSAPAEVQVFEDGRLIGTSRSDRIMVSAGRHELEIVNEALDYRVSRAVTVAPGQVSPVRLEWPKGSMALNAQPWAEVWIDGERVGETPIGNVAVPIGPHEIVFRHPQLGEQVMRATVTAGDVNTRQRRLEEEMMMGVTRTAAACLVLLLLTSARLHGQETLAVARDLYASAEYAEALKLLDRLSTGSATGDEQQSIELYRSLCLLAVGRQGDAERSIEAIIMRDPLYQPGEDLSPRMRSAFTDAKKRLLPSIVQQEYAEAKGAFERKEFEVAASGFRRVVDALNDPSMGPAANQPPLADLRTLAAGFHDLSVKAVPPPPPAPTEPVAALAAAAVAANLPPRIYTGDERNVVPPQTVIQTLPKFPGAVPPRGVSGVIEVVVDERRLGRIRVDGCSRDEFL